MTPITRIVLARGSCDPAGRDRTVPRRSRRVRHIYPEMAAAGLWTTATDLARFAVEVQQSLAGRSNKVLSQAMTREQLTDVGRSNYGLGLAVSGTGTACTFGHNGRNRSNGVGLPLDTVAGYFEFSNNNMMTLAVTRGRLFTDVNGLPDEEFLSMGGGRFGSTQRNVSFRMTRDSTGAVIGLTWIENGKERTPPNVRGSSSCT